MFEEISALPFMRAEESVAKAESYSKLEYFLLLFFLPKSTARQYERRVISSYLS